jgi:hypothetical protein
MTAKLNDVDPQAWLADVLARLADIPQGLLPAILTVERGYRPDAHGAGRVNSA